MLLCFLLADRNKDGKPEFDFDTDRDDIRLPEIRSEEMEGKGKKSYFGLRRTDHIVPEMDYSLRVSEGSQGSGRGGIAWLR